jgi:hypothetical protein
MAGEASGAVLHPVRIAAKPQYNIRLNRIPKSIVIQIQKEATRIGLTAAPRFSQVRKPAKSAQYEQKKATNSSAVATRR